MTGRTTRKVARRCPRRPIAPPAFAPRPLVAPAVTPEVTDAVTRNAPSRPARPAEGQPRAREHGHQPGQSRGLAAAIERLGPSHAELACWAAREPALAGPDSYDELRAEQLDPDVAPQRKDDRLAGLLRLAGHHGTRPAETILALLVPGMGQRIARWAGSLDLDEAWAEMTAGVWARIVRYAAAGPPANRLASKLLGAGTKTMVARRDRDRAWAARTVLCASAPRPANEAHADDELDLRAVLVEAATAGVILERDAELITGTRIEGHTLATVARRAGLGYDTARKRRKTAEHKLIAHQRRRTDGGRSLPDQARPGSPGGLAMAYSAQAGPPMPPASRAGAHADDRREPYQRRGLDSTPDSVHSRHIRLILSNLVDTSRLPLEDSHAPTPRPEGPPPSPSHGPGLAGRTRMWRS